jgi:hypothetical protein
VQREEFIESTKPLHTPYEDTFPPATLALRGVARLLDPYRDPNLPPEDYRNGTCLCNKYACFTMGRRCGGVLERGPGGAIRPIGRTTTALGRQDVRLEQSTRQEDAQRRRVIDSLPPIPKLSVHPYEAG